MLPVIPQEVNALIQDETNQLSTYPFPDNVAELIPVAIRQKIFGYMLKNYIWPQIQERAPFESQWDKLLLMSKAARKLMSTTNENNQNTRLLRATKEKGVSNSQTAGDSSLESASISDRIAISDTLIFDTVDRLTNLNHFISFKEDIPVRYEIPEDVIFPYENAVYSPAGSLIKSANAWLRFNVQQADIFRKDWMCARHHYTYGVSLVESQFYQKIEPVPRRNPANKSQFDLKLELTEIGITFDPISIRRIWLNPRLPVYKMDYQSCPFFFEEMPRFAIVAKTYDKQKDPFGFQNQASIAKAQYLIGAQELDAYQKAFALSSPNAAQSTTQLLAPEFNIEMLWTFYPMLPLTANPQFASPDNPQGFALDEDGTLGIPMQRFIVQTYGNNLCSGKQEIIRLQRNFYPHDSLPIYGSAHMPTLDDGAYPEPIGSILENHYDQICTCLLQAIENKDWINDPPTKVQTSSPAMTKDINKKGAKIPVNSMNDFESRTPYDATGTTPEVMRMIRDQAQASAKVVDAILGKAMGSRTSATEASNIFQTAMSGVTTDVNLYNHDIMGGYATRVWDYTSRWVDPDVLQAITGSYGFRLKPEFMQIRLGLKWDVGSSFIESITRQQNLRYLLESTQPGDPAINRPELYKRLLKEWKFQNVELIINDGGLENEILISTQQAIETYLGKFVMVDPEQDHNIALKVKKSFLTDRKSVWNSDPSYAVNGPRLVAQLEQHQMWIQIEQMQQQLQMQQQAEQQQASQIAVKEAGRTNGSAPPARVNTTAGQVAQEH